MHRVVGTDFAVVALAVSLGVGLGETHAQSVPDLSGMWADAPLDSLSLDEIEVVYCLAGCTDVGLERLGALLDDPANDSRPFDQLVAEARAYEGPSYYRPRLTAAALEGYPLDPADDPSFLRCEPWGLTRQIVAPHHIEIHQYADRVELRYAEWDARRTVWLDGRTRPRDAPATNLGFSVGRYDDDVLVVETTGVAANRARWLAMHSDQLKVVERFRRSGERLELVATLEDPWSLAEPVVMRRIWAWTPHETIAPYEDCQLPTEFRRESQP